MYCGKTADWIRLPFVMVSGIGREMGVLDGDGYSRREWAILGLNLGRPIVSNGDCDAALSKLFWAVCVLCPFAGS